jgi:hypothetical protein
VSAKTICPDCSRHKSRERVARALYLHNWRHRVDPARRWESEPAVGRERWQELADVAIAAMQGESEAAW